jgi:steroid delta-isomerase-like uncharacterized protein
MVGVPPTVSASLLPPRIFCDRPLGARSIAGKVEHSRATTRSAFVLTAQDNAALIRAHFDSFNLRDYPQCLAMVSDDVRWCHVPFSVTFTGKKAYRGYLENWTTAVPNAEVQIVNVIPGDVWTAVEFIGHGVHSGSFIGPRSTALATESKIELECCGMFRVEDGLIMEAHVYFDGAALMTQVGLMPNTETEEQAQPSIL